MELARRDHFSRREIEHLGPERGRSDLSSAEGRKRAVDGTERIALTFAEVEQSICSGRERIRHMVFAHSIGERAGLEKMPIRAAAERSALRSEPTAQGLRVSALQIFVTQVSVAQVLA